MSKSHMDESIAVDQNNWTVTLICVRGSNHAEIIIEGVDDNEDYFMKMAHFIGKFSGSLHDGNTDISYCGFNTLGEVKAFRKLDPNKLKYDGKSETWLKSKSKVLDLIRAVEDEAENPEKKPRVFNILGRDSFFAQSKYIPDKVQYEKSSFLTKIYFKSIQFFSWGSVTPMSVISPCRAELVEPDNCFTWAREKLKLIDVQLPENRFSCIANLTRLYTNPGGSPVKLKFT